MILVIHPSLAPFWALWARKSLINTSADCNSVTNWNMASPGIRVRDIVANHNDIEVTLNLADIKTARWLHIWKHLINIKMLHI